MPMRFAADGPVQLIDTVNSSVPQCPLGEAPVDDVVDPYEIAYLRGGEKEVLKLVLFDLLERGYLEVREFKNGIWTRQELVAPLDGQTLRNLTPLERDIVARFAEPMSASQIFQIVIPRELASRCSNYQMRLQRSGLISQHSDATLKLQQAASSVLVFVIAVFLISALPPLAAFIATSVVSILVYCCLVPTRLTKKGKQRLAELESRYAGLKDRPKMARADVHDQSLALSVAVFGAGILAGSVYDAFTNAAAEASSGDGGGDDGCGGCGCGCG